MVVRDILELLKVSIVLVDTQALKAIMAMM